MFMEEGIFTIRVSMLGPNLCLLEDLVMGKWSYSLRREGASGKVFSVKYDLENLLTLTQRDWCGLTLCRYQVMCGEQSCSR